MRKGIDDEMPTMTEKDLCAVLSDLTDLIERGDVSHNRLCTVVEDCLEEVRLIKDTQAAIQHKQDMLITAIGPLLTEQSLTDCRDALTNKECISLWYELLH